MAVSFNEKYKNKFIDDLFDRREAELKRAAAEFIAEGKAEGKAEGEARARIDSIRRVLKSRGLRPSRAERELIESCTDLNTLVAWFDRSLTATKVSDIFED